MTGNFRAMYSRNGLGVVPRLPFLNGKSTTIQAGHPVVITTNATYTTSSYPVVRSLVAGDISASYQEGGSTAGILGFSLEDYVTTSGGVDSTQFVYSAKAGAAEPVLVIPSYHAGVPVDPTILYTKMMVALALPGVVFRGKLGGGGTTTATEALVNTKAGIDLNAGVYTVDTSESVKPLTIIGWDVNNTAYVYFEVQQTYCQLTTGVNYSSQ